MQPVDHQKLQNQLDLGEIDLALVTPEAVTPGLHAIALFDESYACVMRSEHPDAMNSEISMDRFCALDHVLVSPAGGGFHGVADEALEKLGRSRRVTVSVTSFLVLPEILMCSDLIAVVPRRLAVHQVGLRSLEPPVEIPGFRKILVWHERTHSDAGHRWVRSLPIETTRALD
ncbi:LysR substrate-binding domain-containing protein [Pseudomonas syringae group genomosp. 7]|uniref:LysR substrate-binding domain-containing protein n=1 Tax=Pseudomonas syringae group genomosp. 7 TaxID=251699 RepID=UPI000F3F410D|nr:LysR substrate-binding domain-containing protein [Pseudomonas syringae group genomosp. 7]RMR01954.1 Transcriptional regulator, LysR family [Pseudomonas syringae pv. helianthi]